MHNMTADSLWRAFCDVIDTAIDLYVPYAADAPENSSSLHGRKYPRYIKKLIARKRCIWRQHRKYPNNQFFPKSMLLPAWNANQQLKSLSSMLRSALLRPIILDNFSDMLIES